MLFETWLKELKEEAAMKTDVTKQDVDNVLGKPETSGKFLEVEHNLLEQLDKRRQASTPDFIERKLDSAIPVLVYGTLKAGHYNHRLLEGMPYVGEGQTAAPDFYMMETLSFPTVFKVTAAEKDKRKLRGKIHGEVYMVDPLTLVHLDELEANGNMYTREQVWVQMLDQKNSGVTPTIPCWIYIANYNYFDPRFLHSVKPETDLSGRYLRYTWNEEIEQQWAM